MKDFLPNSLFILDLFFLKVFNINISDGGEIYGGDFK